MIIKFDNYKLNEDNEFTNGRAKLLLTIEIFNLVDLIGGRVDIIYKKIYYTKDNIIKNIYIKNNNSGNDLFAEIEDYSIKDTYHVGFLNNLSIEQMREIYDYLKDRYPDEYNNLTIKKDSNKFNL